MQAESYTVDATLQIPLARLAALQARLQAAGALTTSAGQAAEQELRALFIFHGAGIQGNPLALDAVRVLLHTAARGPLSREQQGIVNLANGLEYVFMLAADELPLTERLIRIMHALVMRELLPAGEEPGVYRTADLPELGYGAPVAYAVTAEMGTFARWLAARPTAADYVADPLTRAVVAHTWLLITHPFLNGNGRTARLLLNLILLRAGYPLCVLHAADRPRYLAALDAAGLRHDLTPMLALCSERLGKSLALYAGG